jgi:hypothetical protein
MAASSRFVYPYVRAFQSDNSVAPGWKLNFYTTGTSARLDTYYNADLAPGHENPNPVIADADGQFGDIFLGSVANYKVVLTDENDVVVDTADPVAPPTVPAASTSTPGIIQIATLAQHLAANTTNLATVPQYVANMIQQGFSYATMGNTGDVITATLAPVPAAYASGMQVFVRMTAANTTVVTLNVNNLGAIAVKKRTNAGSTALTANDLLANVEYLFIYDSADSCFWVSGVQAKGTLLAVTQFSGSGTWTRPVGCNSVIFVAVGGGGAGGGSISSGASNGSIGGGGGAGGFGQLYKTNPAASYAITIGAGGVAVSGANGGNGGNTTVGAILTANGGSGGVTTATSSGPQAAAGGAGGTATSGDINGTGAAGGVGANLQNASGNADANWGGNGAPTQFGGGGIGAVNDAAAAVAGTAAVSPGAGGGGAATLGTASSQAGGNGAAGFVIAYSYS